jgi:hypothetical protein
VAIALSDGAGCGIVTACGRTAAAPIAAAP